MRDRGSSLAPLPPAPTGGWIVPLTSAAGAVAAVAWIARDHPPLGLLTATLGLWAAFEIAVPDLPLATPVSDLDDDDDPPLRTFPPTPADTERLGQDSAFEWICAATLGLTVATLLSFAMLAQRWPIWIGILTGLGLAWRFRVLARRQRAELAGELRLWPDRLALIVGDDAHVLPFERLGWLSYRQASPAHLGALELWTTDDTHLAIRSRDALPDLLDALREHALPILQAEARRQLREGVRFSVHGPVPRRLGLAAAAITLIAAGSALTIGVGHAIGPLMVAIAVSCLISAAIMAWASVAVRAGVHLTLTPDELAITRWRPRVWSLDAITELRDDAASGAIHLRGKSGLRLVLATDSPNALVLLSLLEELQPVPVPPYPA